MTTSKETKYTPPQSKSKWFRGGNPTHPLCNWWHTIPRGRQTLHIHCIAICTHISPTAISPSRPPQKKQCFVCFCCKFEVSIIFTQWSFPIGVVYGYYGIIQPLCECSLRIVVVIILRKLP